MPGSCNFALYLQLSYSGREDFAPSFPAKNVNAAIKAAFAKLLIEPAELYSPRGFRRGAAQELKESGSQRPAISPMGDWGSLAFLGYADLAFNVEREIAKLLIGTDSADSDEGEVHRWVSGPLARVRASLGVMAPLTLSEL